MTPDPVELWKFLPIGYGMTILLETPILLVGLSRRHSIRQRLLAGIWLTACTYPIVVLVLPIMIEARFGRVVYLAVAETFAPVAECLLFWLAFKDPHRPSDETANQRSTRFDTLRDMVAIVVANLCSWLLGGWLYELWIH